MNYKESMLPDACFEGKNIIITGGGSGLGLSMAKYLSTLGAQVIITSRNMEKLQKGLDQIEAAGGKPAVALSCDVRDYDQVKGVVQHCVEQFGTVDGLINNAAGNFISPSERLSANAFDTIIDIVLKGSKNFTLACGKYWIKSENPGTVVNIVTTYANTGSGYVVPSAMAKAGVVAMTKSLAVEWAKYGIRSNAIAPGPFPTKGAWDRLLPGELMKKFDPSKRIPLQRMGEHQELANLAAYLLSDYSAYINGEVITIDGGEWLQGAGQFNQLASVPKEMWDTLEMMIRGKKQS